MEGEIGHWTEELFEKYPNLFLPAIEQRIAGTSDEIEILLQHLKEQGYQPNRILDLNCGIGRHTIELGRRGIAVLGTDISSQYIEQAREKAKEVEVEDKVKFHVADMRDIVSHLTGEALFDGIICLWTSFGFYDDESNERILRDCLKFVRKGGFFVLEIINRDWLLQNYIDCRFSRSDGGIVLQEGKFDPHTSRNLSTWTFLKRISEDNYTLEKSVQLDHRIWSLHELICLFNNTGWRFKATYPGLSVTGFTPQKLAHLSKDDDILKSPMLFVMSYRP